MEFMCAELVQSQEAIELARRKFKTDFAQGKEFVDLKKDDPFFQWKDSPHAFKATLTQDHVSPLTTRYHEPVIGDPTYSGGFAIPRVVEWITGGKLYRLYLLEGTAVESIFTREVHPVLKKPTVVETPRQLNDDEFRGVVEQLRQDEAISRTGVLADIESKREWRTK